jgi:aminoglycoside phosphotransferase (APT) family kinase protein
MALPTGDKTAYGQHHRGGYSLEGFRLESKAQGWMQRCAPRRSKAKQTKKKQTNQMHSPTAITAKPVSNARI